MSRSKNGVDKALTQKEIEMLKAKQIAVEELQKMQRADKHEIRRLAHRV